MKNNYIPCTRVKVVNEKELNVILMDFFSEDVIEILALANNNPETTYFSDDFAVSTNPDGLYLIVHRKTDFTWLYSLTWQEEDAEFYVINSKTESVLKDGFDYKPYQLGEYFAVPYNKFHANLRHADTAPF